MENKLENKQKNKLLEKIENRFVKNTEPKNYSNFFYVMFGDKLVHDGDFFTLDDVNRPPKYRFNRMRNSNIGKFHAIVMVDPDSPLGFYVHQCIYDIPVDNVTYGKVFYAYTPPNPPAGSGPEEDGRHRYFCILYEQGEKIDRELEPVERPFKTYKDFTTMLGTTLMPKASKYFICEHGVYV